MNPLDVVFWALAVLVAVIVAALVISVIVGLVRTIVRPRKHGSINILRSDRDPSP